MSFYSLSLSLSFSNYVRIFTLSLSFTYPLIFSVCIFTPLHSFFPFSLPICLLILSAATVNPDNDFNELATKFVVSLTAMIFEPETVPW